MRDNVPFVSLERQYLKYKAEIDEAFSRVASSGAYIFGEEVEAFEKDLAEICGVPYVLTVANGTDASILAMKALGIGKGDEVITAPNSFIASASSIIAVGATPVFADVCEDHNIDPEAVKAAITDKTKAIVPVHLTGRPAKMGELMSLGLPIVEDAAQAIGALYKGQPVGSFGEFGCFSLHPLKNLFVMGDGGFISMKSEEHYERLKHLRNHGLINRNECVTWSMNSRLDAVHAAIGRVKTRHFDKITARFRAVADRYRESLRDVVHVPEDTADQKAVYHNFVILTEKRDELQQYLQSKGIGCAIHYPVLLHLQEAAKDIGYKLGDFPVAEMLNKKQLSLPIYPEITNEEIDTVISRIKEFY